MTCDTSVTKPMVELQPTRDGVASWSSWGWPSRDLADRCPEEYLACVEAGTERTSAGPNWNYSRTSDLIFLQEQMKAM